MVKGRRQHWNRVVAIVASIALVVGLMPLPAVAASESEPEGQAPGAASAVESVASTDAPEVSEGEAAEAVTDGAYAAGQGEEAEVPEPGAEQAGETPASQADASAITAPAATDNADAKAGEVEKADVAEAPAKAEEGAEPAKAESPAFRQSATVDGVTVTVEADAGAFPEGARLSVASAPSSATEAAVAPERSAGQNVAVSYTFDIKVLGADGAELQPADGRSVRVSFAAAEVADPNLDVSVYHVSGGAADELVVSESGTTATATSGGFSYYTVEFTYGDLQYVLQGGESIPLADILAAVGLQGEPEAVEVSDPELFSASEATGTWMITSHKAFSSDEWMRVTIAGKPYEIVVTDAKFGNLFFSVDQEGKATITGIDFVDPDYLVIPAEVTDGEHTYPVTAIGDVAFSDYASLLQVEIPESVTSIGYGAFMRCSSLRTVTIPGNVTSIGDRAFDDCSSLKTVTIPESVKTIGSCAFRNCLLETVTIPESVTSIGESAFRGNQHATSVTINCGAQHELALGANAFKGIYPNEATLQWAGGDVPEGCHVVFVVAPDNAGYSVNGGTLIWDDTTESVTLSAKLKRDITITAASQTWPYDGKEHESKAVDVTKGKLADGDELVAVATGSVTNVVDTDEGNNPIAEGYKIMRNGTEVTDEYAITPVAGTLTITKAPLTITAVSQTLPYNGAIQGEGDTVYDNSDVIAKKVTTGSKELQEGDSVASIEIFSQGKDIGTYPITVKSAVIQNASSKDVTNNYAITYVNGTLKIVAESYEITFVNYDGTVLQSGKVAYGEMPKYTGATPTKPATTEYTYTFKGWEPEIAKATENTTYKATFTEKAKKGVYEVVSGAGGTWTEGSSEPLVFVFKRTADDETTFDHFTGILMDGKAVPEKDSSGRVNWTAEKGSVIVSLQPSYVATLSEGNHTLTAQFDDGNNVDASFTVAAKAATPKTGDGNGMLVIGLSVAALMALCTMAYAVRRRRDS